MWFLPIKIYILDQVDGTESLIKLINQGLDLKRAGMTYSGLLI